MATIHSRNLKWVHLLLTGLFLLGMYILISHVALSSTSLIQITYESDRSDPIGAYYSMGYPAVFTNRRSTFSKEVPILEKTEVRLVTNNRLTRNLRLDLGRTPGWVKLYGLELHSNFADAMQFGPKDIYERFVYNDSISSFELKQDHVLARISGNHPQLVSDSPLSFKNWTISLILPFAFSIAFYLVVSTFSVASFPAFLDLSNQVSSASINYASLDGIRGMAVLLVLLEHTLHPFKGAGIGGVWIFFVLSGFLLAIPFVKNPELAMSRQYMGEYLLRRLKRIIPMYYFFIVIAFFMRGKFGGGAFRHLLFLQGDGYLWTIPQEMLFYLFLPFIMIGLYVLCRGRPFWSVAGLTILMMLMNTYLGKHVLSIYGQNIAMPAFIGIFLCGVLFSYLYHGLILPDQSRYCISVNIRRVFSVLGMMLLVSYVLLATETLLWPEDFLRSNNLLVSKYRSWFAVAAGLLILFALLSKDTLYNKLLSWTPLRAIGLVGFSFYLLHPVVIGLIREMQEYFLGYTLRPEVQLIMVLAATYFFAAFTYSYIERPFLKRASQSRNDRMR